MRFAAGVCRGDSLHLKGGVVRDYRVQLLKLGGGKIIYDATFQNNVDFRLVNTRVSLLAKRLLFTKSVTHKTT